MTTIVKLVTWTVRKVGDLQRSNSALEKKHAQEAFHGTRLTIADEDSSDGDAIPFLEKPKTKSVGETPGHVIERRPDYIRRVYLYLLATVFSTVHLIIYAWYLIYKGKVLAHNPRTLLANPWVLLVYLMELGYYGSSLIAAMDNALPPSNRPSLDLQGENFPTVDIMIPCCKEPTDVPVESIRAALNLDYPSDRFRVLVLDDGGDDDLKAISESLGVETGGQVVYLRRRKIPGVPHHFKCGNLNYGMGFSTSEYVVMMDADMILHKSFLLRLLPHIVNSPNISFVQIPQSFYNLPLGDPLSDSSMIGYDKILIHRDTLGYATCIGTGCLFRRKHLNAIGGFQSQSITEDTTTAFSLFRAGYRSAYINEKLQIGLTPWTFEGYVKQRMRWGQGAVQQFKATWRDMLGKSSKLNFFLKFLYFWHSGYYFLSFLNIAMVVTFTFALAFRWRLTVGTQDENRKLLLYLSYGLASWRIYWYITWLPVPLTMQSRNRDESHFWWMSPFFMKMILESIFNYSATFKFVPTSNIDRNVAKAKQSAWEKKLDQLKHVRFHIAYTVIVVHVVIARVGHTFLYKTRDCMVNFYVLSLSFFLLCTCAHMMLPVLYILWPTGFAATRRRSLLRYNANGVPIFNPNDCKPKWRSSVLFYEALSIGQLAFWVCVGWMLRTGADQRLCADSLGFI